MPGACSLLRPRLATSPEPAAISTAAGWPSLLEPLNAIARSTPFDDPECDHTPTSILLTSALTSSHDHILERQTRTTEPTRWSSQGGITVRQISRHASPSVSSRLLARTAIGALLCTIPSFSGV